ncbi:MAG: ACP S-malonyltransferase [Chloroflexi bacterium]|nr:ACP S-malonyltransferase [Chloroflexota bacterium]
MLTPATTAFVFPGQGSQVVGMGRALAETSPAARAVFEEADDILKFKLSALCWDGPEETLTDTINAQPALYVCGIAALRALEEKLGEFKPACVAGHSLGELTALTAVGSMEFEDGLPLVRERGRLMKAAGEENPGGMAAILNLDASALVELCAEASAATGGVVQVANDNCPGQVVISGSTAALEKAMEIAKARGAKRALRLPVSIAAHSPLMKDAAAKFKVAVDAIPFIFPALPVVGNVGAQALADANGIRAELPAQLTSPVRWADSVRYMLSLGVTTFLELGSKDVLTGLLKRIDSNAKGIAVGTPEAIVGL